MINKNLSANANLKVSTYGFLLLAYTAVFGLGLVPLLLFIWCSYGLVKTGDSSYLSNFKKANKIYSWLLILLVIIAAVIGLIVELNSRYQTHTFFIDIDIIAIFLTPIILAIFHNFLMSALYYDPLFKEKEVFSQAPKTLDTPMNPSFDVSKMVKELKNLKDLENQGILSPEEFEIAKQKLLAS